MSEARQLSIFDPPSKEQKLTQCMKIVKYMHDFGSITPVQAMQDLGVMRLAARSATWRRRDGKLNTSGKPGRTATGKRPAMRGTG